MKNHDQAYKDFALLEEIDASTRMIIYGMGEIQRISHSNGFYFTPLQFLANGFERLLKCMICLGYNNIHSQYPTSEYIKTTLSHKIDHILSVFMKEHFKSWTERTNQDKEFLMNDRDLKMILEILSDFAQIGRYGNLNVVTGLSEPFTDSIQKWKKFEAEPLKTTPDLLDKLTQIGEEEYVYHRFQQRIIIILEKAMRALSLQFTMGNLGDLARKTFGSLDYFPLMKDSQLGRTDYRNFYSWYKKKQHIKHKRNWFGMIKRVLNPKVKWKTIRKSEYPGDWPYFTDKVIIECYSKIWCVVCIEGKSYALNGIAKGRFNIDDAYDAGVAIRGIFPHELIKIARSW